jgi:hypothetical protein
MPSSRALIAIACSLALLSSGSAQAAAPPKGKYDCVIGQNSILFGTLTIKGGKRYSHRGDKGKFRAKGKKLRFKSGPLAKIRGRWYKTSSARVEIALRNPGDDFESIYCTKR